MACRFLPLHRVTLNHVNTKWSKVDIYTSNAPTCSFSFIQSPSTRLCKLVFTDGLKTLVLVNIAQLEQPSILLELSFYVLAYRVLLD